MNHANFNNNNGNTQPYSPNTNPFDYHRLSSSPPPVSQPSSIPLSPLSAKNVITIHYDNEITDSKKLFCFGIGIAWVLYVILQFN